MLTFLDTFLCEELTSTKRASQNSNHWLLRPTAQTYFFREFSALMQFFENKRWGVDARASLLALVWYHIHFSDNLTVRMIAVCRRSWRAERVPTSSSWPRLPSDRLQRSIHAGWFRPTMASQQASSVANAISWQSVLLAVNSSRSWVLRSTDVSVCPENRNFWNLIITAELTVKFSYKLLDFGCTTPASAINGSFKSLRQYPKIAYE